MLEIKSLRTRSTKKKKRVGRGTGSGHGKTCCRGNKGQKSRSGGTKGKYFEGGQTPFYRRLPKKRGFKNLLFRKEYAVINVSDLQKLGVDITPELLREKGLIKRGQLIKVLGGGKLEKAIKVSANAFSKGAKEIIEKSGGTATIC